jgi:uncharacterized membrane protein
LLERGLVSGKSGNGGRHRRLNGGVYVGGVTDASRKQLKNLANPNWYKEI